MMPDLKTSRNLRWNVLTLVAVLAFVAAGALTVHGQGSPFAGMARVRDAGAGLLSNRLVVTMSNAPAVPAGRDLRCYLLNANGLGQPCPNPLTVNNGVVNETVDFAGRNLVADVTGVRFMQETLLFSASLPATALVHIRTAVASAPDTPGKVGYSAGLLSQAQIIATHAGFAKSAVDNGNLVEARMHAEHVLNTLYGEADQRYGDHDGDGLPTNPGDGYGLLRYSTKLDQTMQQVAGAADATTAMISRAQEVRTTLTNIGNSTDGKWAALLITRATELLAAANLAAAQTPATGLVGVANRVYTGEDLNDNGEAEPIANEGGARTAHRYAQRTADYLPPAGSVGGSVQHGDRAADPTGDLLRFSLTGLPSTVPSDRIWAYLLDNNDNRLPVGPVAINGATVDASIAITGVNLIAGYNTIYVTLGAFYADGSLPAAAMAPLRLALHQAPDTPANTSQEAQSADAAHDHHQMAAPASPDSADAPGKGYAVGLLGQAQILRQHSGFAQSSLAANSLSSAKMHIEHVLNTLYGAADARYGDHDGDGIPTNPGDGYGLLRYRSGLITAMQALQSHASTTQQMKDRAGEVLVTLDNIGNSTDGKWAALLIARAQEVLAATTVAQAQTPINQLVALAERLLNGEDLDDDGQVEPVANEGGALTAYQTAQNAADITLTLRIPPDGGGGTPTPVTPQPGAGDAFEDDDACNRASTINPTGAIQNHTFHDAGDTDWIKFHATANKTYKIELANLGAAADGMILLHEACGADPSANQNNAFGSIVTLEWDSTKHGDLFLELRQFDPAFFDAATDYRLTVTEDATPPIAPSDLRCIAENQTTVGVQWKRSQERDVVKYRITFRNENATDSGNREVNDPQATFLQLGNLAPNELYLLDVVAVDFSNNSSPKSGEIPCRAATPNDASQPSFSLQQPAAASVITTTASLVTFSGLAQDSGGNLSRVNVRNASTGAEGWDFTLSGASDDFRVKDLPLQTGDNTVQVTVFDEAGNSSKKTVTVKRQGSGGGAALIVAGHNETFGLQTNIYNAANRAYRLFKTAGFSDDNIFYIAPVAQDADGDGDNDVDAAASPAAVTTAITGWAAEAGRVGPGKPFHVYMIDHGFAEKFCVSGCSGGFLTPKALDDALRTLETASGVTDVNVIIEACQSGSFVDRFQGDIENSLAKQGRVIIASTGRVNNAYASAEGAYFSDAFFSCLADSGSLKACFDQATAAVDATGVDQTPLLDDNGDALFTAGDGGVAQGRTLTKFFSSTRPQIVSVTLDRQGANGTLSAIVQEGAEEIDIVWAAVYPPSFQEPSDVTINLNVPTVRLERNPNDDAAYSFVYTGGFPETGDYRVIFYAQDRLGIHAQPKTVGEAETVYLPVVVK